MPDGGDPCEAFTELQAEIERLRGCRVVSPEQIEAAAKAAYKAALGCWNPFCKRWEELGDDDTGVTQEHWRIIARAALTTEPPKP